MSLTIQLGLAGALAMSWAATADADSVSLTEAPGHVTEATVVIDASPHEIYRRVTDYARWRDVLSDIEAVKVERGDRDHATVRFRSRAFGQTVTVELDNIPDRLIRFRGIEGPPGGRARGEYRLTPIDGGRRTLVTARLYLDVVGPPGWFVRDETIRAMRRTKLRTDLEDVARWFAARSAERSRTRGQHAPR